MQILVTLVVFLQFDTKFEKLDYYLQVTCPGLSADKFQTMFLSLILHV